MLIVLITQVDLVLDKADLAATVIHKWVPTHGIYFIRGLTPQNPAPSAAAGQPSPAEHRNFATGP